MNRFTRRILAGLALIAIASAVALADRKSDTVTFPSDVKLAGATVKAGTYKVQFDYKKNELSVINDSNKSVATASGHVEQAERKARTTEIETSAQDNNNIVTSITFGGDNRKIVIDGTSAETKSGSR